MSFQDFLNQDRRHSILKILCRAPQAELNEAVMETALQSLGHKVAYECFLADLQFLQTNQLIELTMMDGLRILRITRRGKDAANNLSKIKGVHS